MIWVHMWCSFFSYVALNTVGLPFNSVNIYCEIILVVKLFPWSCLIEQMFRNSDEENKDSEWFITVHCMYININQPLSHVHNQGGNHFVDQTNIHSLASDISLEATKTHDKWTKVHKPLRLTVCQQVVNP